MEQYEVFPLEEEIRDVLAALELSAEKSWEEVEREIGHPPEQIDAVVRRLTEAQIVESIPLVDIAALGLSEYVFYASLATPRGPGRSKLIDLLVRSERVQWVAHFEGAYQYGVAVRARDIGELGDFIDNLLLGMPEAIARKTFGIRRCCHVYGRRYLSKKPIVRPTLQIGDSRGPAASAHQAPPARRRGVRMAAGKYTLGIGVYRTGRRRKCPYPERAQCDRG